MESNGKKVIKIYVDKCVEGDDESIWHTCPYAEEIHNDHESLCDCDDERTHQCAMDI